MDYERELAEAMQRAEAKVAGHEAGEHTETIPGCFPCFLRAAGRGPFSPVVEAVEAAETIAQQA
jgi:hypothetical protein